MSGARLWPLATLVLGLVTLAVFLALGRQPDVSAVYGAGEVAASVSAFQRAETLGDIAAVFGSPADPRRIAAMDAINRLDLWAFVPAYVLFLAAAAIMLAQARSGPLLWAAIAFALIGGAADAVETAKQLRLTADWDNTGAYLPIAPWHWLKYTALALNGFAVAGICLLGEPRRWLLGAIALAPLPCVLAAWAGLAETRLFSAAFALYWIALLVGAAAGNGSKQGDIGLAWEALDSVDDTQFKRNPSRRSFVIPGLAKQEPGTQRIVGRCVGSWVPGSPLRGAPE